MKLFLSFACLLFVSMAFATPTVGDVVVFNISGIQSNTAFTGTYTMTITSADPVAQTYSVHTTIVANGGTQEKNTVRAAKDMLDDSTIQSVLTNCPEYGGTLQSVSTPAGFFNACAIPNNQQNMTGTSWVAAVPFGLIQTTQNYANGNSANFNLASFQAGTK